MIGNHRRKKESRAALKWIQKETGINKSRPPLQLSWKKSKRISANRGKG